MKFTLASLVHELCICTFLLTTLSTSVNRFIAKKRDSFRLYSHFHLRERLFARWRRLVGLLCVLSTSVSSFGLSKRLSILLHRKHGFFLLPSLRIPPIPHPLMVPLFGKSPLPPSSPGCLAQLCYFLHSRWYSTRSQNGFFLISRYIIFVGFFFLNSCGLVLRAARGREETRDLRIDAMTRGIIGGDIWVAFLTAFERTTRI